MKTFLKTYIDEFRKGSPSQKIAMIADMLALFGAATVLAFARLILERFLAVPFLAVIVITFWVLVFIVVFLTIYGAYSRFASPRVKSMPMGKVIDMCLRAILTLGFIYGITLLYEFIKIVHW